MLIVLAKVWLNRKAKTKQIEAWELDEANHKSDPSVVSLPAKKASHLAKDIS